MILSYTGMTEWIRQHPVHELKLHDIIIIVMSVI